MQSSSVTLFGALVGRSIEAPALAQEEEIVLRQYTSCKCETMLCLRTSLTSESGSPFLSPALGSNTSLWQRKFILIQYYYFGHSPVSPHSQPNNRPQPCCQIDTATQFPSLVSKFLLIQVPPAMQGSALATEDRKAQWGVLLQSWSK